VKTPAPELYIIYLLLSLYLLCFALLYSLIRLLIGSKVFPEPLNILTQWAVLVPKCSHPSSNQIKFIGLKADKSTENYQLHENRKEKMET
jgi:hypothetical protein